ncbi:sulfurtransferase [Plakobranchus ocellatus]|uniref:Sulfurtransferase n=1 Tax=Plakobranchus ocellatus TaxID=259542 RepID=A0AAV3ZMA3_9GAST|nr:sulfurtransferase [Plakobranchus ocellatus]
MTEMSANIPKVSALVTSAWLKQQIQSAAQNFKSASKSLRILDSSWVSSSEVDCCKEFYQQGHIPTAIFFDLRTVCPAQHNAHIKYPIPDSNFFKEYVQGLGISNDTHIIVYDRLNTYRPSFRIWFLFRLFGHNQVSVLDGGLKQWIKDGNDVTTETSEVEPGVFNAQFQPHLIRDHMSMVKNIDTGVEQVIDARKAQTYLDGHIPGSKNIAYPSIFNEDGTFRTPSELRQLFVQAGVDLDSPIVASCGGGMTACILIAAAHVLGKEDVPLHNGSFREWSALTTPNMISHSEFQG